MEILHRLPFVRILLFFCVGISISLTSPQLSPPLWTLLPPLLSCIIFSFPLGKQQFQKRWLFGICLSLLLVIAAIIRTQQSAPTIWNREAKSSTYLLAELEETPQRGKSTFRSLATLHGPDIPQGTKVQLYIATDTCSATLQFGEMILFPVWLVKKQPQDSYGAYLKSIGCSGTIYLPRGRWKSIGNTHRFSLIDHSRKIRNDIENRFARGGVSGDELAIVSALSLGDKSHLSKETKEAYSATGANHILAVSGLHVGIVYMVFLFLLSRLMPCQSLKNLRITFVLLLLWGYAFIAGLSPSVVRASIMLSLVAIGEILNRKATTLNTVFASAFLMLMYQPHYLIDVGFQLSFSAVLAILLFQEKIYKTIIFKGYLPDKIWSLISVSLAAQLGTLPIVLYHFHRFSNLFGISGLIVIPAATLLIYGSALLAICSSIPVLSTWIGSLINFVTQTMNQSIRWLEKVPHAAVGEVAFTGVDMLFMYAILAAMLATLQLRSFRRIALFLSLILLYTLFIAINKLVGR